MAIGNELTYDTTPLYTQSDSYSAQDDRRPWDMKAPGVANGTIGQVSYAGSGLGLNITGGTMWVRAVNTDGGSFRCRASGTLGPLTLAASDPTYPRLDQIVLLVYDNAFDSQGQDLCKISVVTPGNTSSNAGATLDNRTNAVNLDTGLTGAKHYLLLADVLVPNGATTLSGTNIRDRRSYVERGTVPGLLTYPTKNIVTFEPHPATHGSAIQGLTSDYASRQSCALMWLPRPIFSATSLRWRYIAGSGGGIGTGQSWKMAICDASGRLVTNTSGTECITAATAFAGTTNNATAEQIVSLGGTFDFLPGWYRIWFGVSALTGTGVVRYRGVCADGTSTGISGGQASVADVLFGKTSGGTTFGDGATNQHTVLYMTDSITADGASLAWPPVPVISLSN